MAKQPGKRVTVKTQETSADDGLEVEVGGQDEGAAEAAVVTKTEDQQPDVKVETQAATEAEADQGPTQEEIDAWRKAHEESEGLRKRAEDAERRAADAAKRAQEADERAAVAGKGTIEAKTAAITNSIDALSGKLAAHKQSIARAHEAGDFAAVADATVELTKVQAQLMQLEEGKSALAEEARRPAPKPQPSSEIEAQLQGVPQKSADWLRAHPEYLTDSGKQRKVLAAHQLAVINDIVPESDTYFRFIEEQVGLRQKARPTADDDGDDDGEVEIDDAPATRTPAKGAVRKGAVAAAPVSRSQGGGLRADGGSRPTRVRLTAGELATAERLGMTAQRYAQRKLEYQEREKLRGNR